MQLRLQVTEVPTVNITTGAVRTGGNASLFLEAVNGSGTIDLATEFLVVSTMLLQLNLYKLSDGVEYSTSEYEYRKKLRVQVLILKNVLK